MAEYVRYAALLEALNSLHHTHGVRVSRGRDYVPVSADPDVWGVRLGHGGAYSRHTEATFVGGGAVWVDNVSADCTCDPCMEAPASATANGADYVPVWRDDAGRPLAFRSLIDGEVRAGVWLVAMPADSKAEEAMAEWLCGFIVREGGYRRIPRPRFDSEAQELSLWNLYQNSLEAQRRELRRLDGTMRSNREAIVALQEQNRSIRVRTIRERRAHRMMPKGVYGFLRQIRESRSLNGRRLSVLKNVRWERGCLLADSDVMTITEPAEHAPNKVDVDVEVGPLRVQINLDLSLEVSTEGRKAEGSPHPHVRAHDGALCLGNWGPWIKETRDSADPYGLMYMLDQILAPQSYNPNDAFVMAHEWDKARRAEEARTRVLESHKALCEAYRLSPEHGRAVLTGRMHYPHLRHHGVEGEKLLVSQVQDYDGVCAIVTTHSGASYRLRNVPCQRLQDPEGPCGSLLCLEDMAGKAVMSGTHRLQISPIGELPVYHHRLGYGRVERSWHVGDTNMVEVGMDRSGDKVLFTDVPCAGDECASLLCLQHTHEKLRLRRGMFVSMPEARHGHGARIVPLDGMVRTRSLTTGNAHVWQVDSVHPRPCQDPACENSRCLVPRASAGSKISKYAVVWHPRFGVGRSLTEDCQVRFVDPPAVVSTRAFCKGEDGDHSGPCDDGCASREHLFQVSDPALVTAMALHGSESSPDSTRYLRWAVARAGHVPGKRLPQVATLPERTLSDMRTATSQEALGDVGASEMSEGKPCRAAGLVRRRTLEVPEEIATAWIEVAQAATMSDTACPACGQPCQECSDCGERSCGWCPHHTSADGRGCSCLCERCGECEARGCYCECCSRCNNIGDNCECCKTCSRADWECICCYECSSPGGDCCCCADCEKPSPAPGMGYLVGTEERCDCCMACFHVKEDCECCDICKERCCECCDVCMAKDCVCEATMTEAIGAQAPAAP